MVDFTAFNHDEIAAFVVANQGDMDVDGFTIEEVTSALASGKAVMVARPFGFALIELKPGYEAGTMIPHLWAFFVSREIRKKGLGSRFMKELLRQYAKDHHMSLWCDGPRRRKFFGRFGFRIESKDGTMRRMTTNPDWRLNSTGSSW